MFFFCRFSYEGRWKQKLQTYVDFPLDSLDLAQYVIGPKQNLKRYSLYGVSVSSLVVHIVYIIDTVKKKEKKEKRKYVVGDVTRLKDYRECFP